MPNRQLTITAIILFAVSVLFFTFFYGPSKRAFVAPNKTVTIRSPREIGLIWQSSGAHGRTAVIFTNFQNQRLGGRTLPEAAYIETAIQHGIVRSVYIVIPDLFWSEVAAATLMGRGPINGPQKTTEAGFYMVYEGARIHFMPLSKYFPNLQEKVLVVIDPTAWSSEERLRIDNLFQSGLLSTDLLVTIGGGAEHH